MILRTCRAFITILGPCMTIISAVAIIVVVITVFAAVMLFMVTVSVLVIIVTGALTVIVMRPFLIVAACTVIKFIPTICDVLSNLKRVLIPLVSPWLFTVLLYFFNPPSIHLCIKVIPCRYGCWEG